MKLMTGAKQEQPLLQAGMICCFTILAAPSPPTIMFLLTNNTQIMKISIVFLFLFIVQLFRASAQELITKKNGEQIEVQILADSGMEVKYKTADYLDGPTYSIPRTTVFSIRRADGTVDTLRELFVPIAGDQDREVQDLYRQGMKDAKKNYHGYKGAGTGTFVVALLSPVVGLIPAVACSSTRPRTDFLAYPDESLMHYPDYERGYRKEAWKIKKGRVWQNWMVAFGLNLVLAVAIASNN